MAHDHHHHEDDTYFIDQLCMVALSGAFGVICLCLYFPQREMLKLLLGKQFHPFVLGSGIVLIALAIVRAITLWREAKPATAIASLPVVPHNHDHHHHDGHDHDHHHDHDHAHTHAHDHSHDDHEHGWAPWRYVVMLVPIMLFMLGLPNKGPKAADHKDEEGRLAEIVRETRQAANVIALDDWSRLVLFGKIAGDDAVGDVTPIDFKTIMQSVDDPDARNIWLNKTVEMRGQFIPDVRDPRFFSIVRFSMQCCAGDAVDKRVSVFSRDPVTSIKRDAWVKVIGKVEYGRRGNVFVVRLVTVGPNPVQTCNPEPERYIQ